MVGNGGGVILFTSSWRIACINRSVTHSLSKRHCHIIKNINILQNKILDNSQKVRETFSNMCCVRFVAQFSVKRKRSFITLTMAHKAGFLQREIYFSILIKLFTLAWFFYIIFYPWFYTYRDEVWRKIFTYFENGSDKARLFILRC